MATTPAATTTTQTQNTMVAQAAPFVDWVTPWTTLKAFTTGTWTVSTNPFNFATTASVSSTAPAGTTVFQNGQMNFVKQNGIYTIGWVLQVNTNYNPPAGAVFQQWLSPKWVTTPATSYAVYFCSTSTAGTPLTTTAFPSASDPQRIYTSTVDLQTIGVSTTNKAADTLAGATSAAPAPLVWQSASWNSSPSNFLACMGTRGTDDSDSKTGMNKIQVGTAITFRTGFKIFRDATTGAIAWSTSQQDYTYTIIDSGAAILSSSLAAIMFSIAAVSF